MLFRSNTCGNKNQPGGIHKILVDHDALGGKLQVRYWKPGDRIALLGGGRTKVGDLFTNCKIPQALRRVWPLVVSDRGILWVAGLARSALALPGPSTVHFGTLELAGPPPTW